MARALGDVRLSAKSALVWRAKFDPSLSDRSCCVWPEPVVGVRFGFSIALENEQ